MNEENVGIFGFFSEIWDSAPKSDNQKQIKMFINEWAILKIRFVPNLRALTALLLESF